MYDLNIDARQKRWAEAGESGGNVFHVRTRIEDITAENSGMTGSVGVQKEMFLNHFAPGRIMRFVNGIPVDIQSYSVLPFRMVCEQSITLSGGGSGYYRISDNYNRIQDSAPAFTGPRIVTVTFLASSSEYYEWTVLAGGVTISGTAYYGEATNMIDAEGLYPSGLSIYADGRPVSLPAYFTEDSVTHDYSRTLDTFAGQYKLNITGSWLGISCADGTDPLADPGFSGVYDPDSASMLFTFGRGMSAIEVEIPWSSFSTGAAVSIPKPEEQAVASGITMQFGFTGTYGITGAPSIASTVIRFEGAVLNVEDAQTELLDTLTYERSIDIYDIQGSLLTAERVSELSVFYRSPRFVRSAAGQLSLYNLQNSGRTYSWLPFTGEISTSADPRVRSYTAKYASSQLEAADSHATSIINMLRIFKSQYTAFVNETFSTDNDDYPLREEEFDI